MHAAQAKKQNQKQKNIFLALGRNSARPGRAKKTFACLLS